MIHEVRDMKFEVRGLTRGELKKLEADGLDLDGISQIKDQKERYAKMDMVFSWVAPKLNPLDLSPAEIMELFVEIIKHTYLGEGEIKKFIESQKTGSEEGSTTAAPAGKRASRSKDAVQK